MKPLCVSDAYIVIISFMTRGEREVKGSKEDGEREGRGQQGKWKRREGAASALMGGNYHRNENVSSKGKPSLHFVLSKGLWDDLILYF